MSGISRMTAGIIQSNNDDCIKCYAIKAHNGKYIGVISFWKYGRPHIDPLLDTLAVYNSEDEAVAAMKQSVEEIRKFDLYGSLTPEEAKILIN